MTLQSLRVLWEDSALRPSVKQLALEVGIDYIRNGLHWGGLTQSGDGLATWAGERSTGARDRSGIYTYANGKHQARSSPEQLVESMRKKLTAEPQSEREFLEIFEEDGRHSASLIRKVLGIESPLTFRRWLRSIGLVERGGDPDGFDYVYGSELRGLWRRSSPTTGPAWQVVEMWLEATRRDATEEEKWNLSRWPEVAELAQINPAMLAESLTAATSEDPSIGLPGWLAIHKQMTFPPRQSERDQPQDVSIAPRDQAAVSTQPTPLSRWEPASPRPERAKRHHPESWCGACGQPINTQGACGCS